MASASSLHIPMAIQLPSASYNVNRRLLRVPASTVHLRQPSLRCSVVTCARRRGSSVPSCKKKKQGLRLKTSGKEEDVEEDAFEALFKQLEEYLKNDDLSFVDDDDDEITEEDLANLERELGEALADDELLALFDEVDGESEEEVKVNEVVSTNDAATEIEIKGDNVAVDEVPETEIEGNNVLEEEDEENGDENENEGPLELKRWQMRRLAYALKNGRRKTSIKNLAADLCLDRVIVLELLRDPPPDLLMLSATLLDKPEPTVLEPEIKPEDAALLDSVTDTRNTKSSAKLLVHERQENWSAQKRLKKVHVETLERVYRRSKRPTNAMIINIVHVTKIPRKKVVKWFEDKRAEDGVPDQRLPYQRSASETVFTS